MSVVRMNARSKRQNEGEASNHEDILKKNTIRIFRRKKIFSVIFCMILPFNLEILFKKLNII